MVSDIILSPVTEFPIALFTSLQFWFHVLFIHGIYIHMNTFMTKLFIVCICMYVYSVWLGWQCMHAVQENTGMAIENRWPIHAGGLATHACSSVQHAWAMWLPK